MYERSYGSRYNEPGSRDAAVIAKLMRRDIKDAVKAGKLPGKASNYSVRIDKYSGGQSISILAIDLDGMYQKCEGFKPGSQEVYLADDGSIKFSSSLSCGDPWCKAGGMHKDLPHAREHDVLSVEGQRVEKILKDIHWAYNHDGSESMVDYFDRLYWGDASIERPDSGEWRRKEKARAAAKRAAKKAKEAGE